MFNLFFRNKETRFLFGIYKRKPDFNTIKNCLRPVYGLFDEILIFCKENTSILDFGCGPGPLSFTIAEFKKPKSVYGYDINSVYIKEAREVNRFSNVFFTDTLVGDLPKFDTIIIADVLHHILPETEKIKTLKFIFDLNPGDVIIKDLDPANKISSWFNTCTDYLSTRSKVAYISIEKIAENIPDSYRVEKVVFRKYFLWDNYIMHIVKKENNL